ncbi:MAG TPA: acyl-CoA dehydrogenase, partial [Alphaproteobacteria bacterium]|nr:acyl-CoA dehydrogenase [Alphaproteobacteria bacterium]
MAQPLLTKLDVAATAAERYRDTVRLHLSDMLAPAGRLDSSLLEREQFAAHGYAWVATTVAALGELKSWCRRLADEGQLGALERLIATAGFGEYLAQLLGGLAMSQGEVVRPADLGGEAAAAKLAEDAAVRALIANGNTAETRAEIARAAAEGNFGQQGLDDETLEMMREPFRRIAEETAEPFHHWH